MPSRKPTRKISPLTLWFERLMALIALVDLGLVFFDLSYVPWRDFYFRNFPQLTVFYDYYKGIEPHRDTQNYLNTVDELKAAVVENGLQSPQVAGVLSELQGLSVEMIEENPFQVANKSGTLEKIKNRMRTRLFGDKDTSSKEAFSTFWSQNYLEGRWQEEISFYEARIKPLIATNYYRSIGENGELIDRFWKIDRWFIGLFFVEFMVRTWLISRRHTGVRWVPEAMLWRWYDVFLLLPFWRWLRVISVIIRLHQARFPDLEPIRMQISRGFVATFAEELTEVVVIQAINQVQGSVNRGDIGRWLAESATKRYIDLNNTNEVEAIAKRLVQITLCKALPEIQTDLEALLRHNVENALKQSTLINQLQTIPGIGSLPRQITERIVEQIAKLVTEGPKNAYTAIASAPVDPIATQLSDRLVEHFSTALRTELQQQHTLQEIQSLLSDLLEEIKINYVKQVSEEDIEQLIEETQQLRLRAGR